MLQISQKVIGVIFWIICIGWFGQNIAQAQSLNKEGLLRFSEEFQKEQSYQKAKLKKLKNLSAKQIVYLFPSFPVIYESANLKGAETVKNDQIWSGGIAGLSLSGSDQILGYWDADQPRLTHQEYNGRVTFEDSEAGSNDGHATQMVGTMIATGVDSDARGMANQSEVEAYNWNSDISEMATAAANGLLNSAHPYAETAGWTNTSTFCGNELEWTWFSLEEEDSTKAFQFGYYDRQAKNWDSVAYMAPDYLIVKAAGNFRGVGPESQPLKHYTLDSDFNCYEDSTSTREVNGGITGYESINGSAVSKNILVVGAVESSNNNFKDLSSIIPISNSGFGPTDDGRIKPDIVAPTNLYTTGVSSDVSYSTSGGTSAATAVVAGSVALLQEHFKNLSDDTLSSASMRALLAHSAGDIGNTGPDYKTGWGLLNTERAARFLSSNNVNEKKTVFKDSVISDGGSIQIDYSHSSNKPLKVTIAWTDPAGTVPDSGDDPTDQILVNDLDVRVVTPSSATVFPWKLSRANPDDDAVRADNSVDNIEQVLISDPETGSYTISISHKGSLQSGSQRVSILISEIEPVIEFETASNGNWSNSLNWVDGNIPSTSFHQAVINHQITLDTDVSLAGFSFMSTSSELVLNEREVTIYNGVSNSSERGISGDSTAVLNIEGWDSDSLVFKSGKRTLGELNVNTEGDTVNLASDLNVYSLLDLKSGSFNPNQYELKLIADTNHTALFKKSGGNLIGKLTYARLFGEGGSGWRMISAPFQNETYSSLNESFFTQGGSWASNSADSVNSSLWLFNNSDQSFEAYRDADASFSSGMGHLFYMFENDASESSILPVFMEMRGSEPDSVSLDLHRGVEDSLSYNFVGNPFAGTVDWHEIVSDGVHTGSSYAVWDPQSSTYKYYNQSSGMGDAGRYIAPMQGFFVQSTDENAKLNFRQTQKVSINPEKYGKSVSPDFTTVNFLLQSSEGEVLDNQSHLILQKDDPLGSEKFNTRRLSSLNRTENNISFMSSKNEKLVFYGTSMNTDLKEIPMVIRVSEPGYYTVNAELKNSPKKLLISLEDSRTEEIYPIENKSEIFFSEEDLQKEFTLILEKGTAVSNQPDADLPDVFHLKQNYPNPFNPQTLIEFDIPKTSDVKIEVFDIIGRKVRTLLNERKNPGYHSVLFDASNLASGTYFYRLEVGEFVKSKKMVLVK